MGFGGCAGHRIHKMFLHALVCKEIAGECLLRSEETNARGRELWGRTDMGVACLGNSGDEGMKEGKLLWWRRRLDRQLVPGVPGSH
jgi:hypothetical protein